MDQAAWTLLAPGSWPAFVLITSRLSGLMILAPFWSMISIPRAVKGAIVVVLAAVMVPGAAKPDFPNDVLSMPLPLMMEFTIGMVIGLTAAIVNYALMMASEVVALQTGLSLGQVLTPNLETGGPALSQIYWLLGGAVFVSMGGPVAMIEAVNRSLVEFPPGAGLDFSAGPMTVLSATGALFGYAIQLAAPVMVALTLTNIAMAILSRAVPQLNAMAMSFAVTLGIGLLLLGASLPIVVQVLTRWYAAAPAGAEALLNAMATGGPR